MTKQKLETVHHLQVGQILSSSWGYEQTNVNFYQIVEIRGKCKIILREINKVRDFQGSMHGTCVPVKDQFIGEEFARMADKYKSVRITQCQIATLWNGFPETWSSWG